MIKRRFYKLEHGDGDAPSASSSSSSDSELEAEATDDSEEDEDDAPLRQEGESVLSSSGFENGNCSAHEVDLDSSGLSTSHEDMEFRRIGQSLGKDHASSQGNTNAVGLQLSSVVNEDEKGFEVPDCVVRCKSVFKCKLCPRVVCLSVETLNAHLKSKRHARSEKLLREGKLKLLDMDGKFEEETAVPLAQNFGTSQMKRRGRRGQKTRLKKVAMCET